MRSKEEAHDYRYFPDPDLLPLELEDGFDRADRAPSLPELPDAKKARFVADYGLSAYDAGVLVAEARDRRLFRGGGQGPRRQAGRQLGHQRPVRRCSARPARASRTARSRPASLGKLLDLIADGTYQRPDRQGRVRDHVRDRRRPGARSSRSGA